MITAFLIGTLLFLAAFMINIYIIRRFIIRVAGYETYNIQLCNACLLSLKKKINKEENE